MGGDILAAALDYASQGLAVLPVHRKNKRPYISEWQKKATTDAETIKQWFTKWTDANVGIATGQISGGVFIVDVDMDDTKGVDGYESLNRWERDHEELPETAQTITGRGGCHMLFHCSEKVKTRGGILDGIDIRGDGGFFVAPPSIHANGSVYQWELPIDEYGITEANEAVLELVSDVKTEESNTLSLANVIKDGSRNDTLFRAACSMQSKGFSDATILDAIIRENEESCKPPLPLDEVKKTVASALTLKKGVIEIVEEGKDYNLVPLKTTQRNGMVIPFQTQDNAYRVLSLDERLSGVCYNKAAFSGWIRGNVPWSAGSLNRMWDDFDDSHLLGFMERHYGLTSEKKIFHALREHVSSNRIDPFMEFINSLPPWDGVARLDSLLPAYLGAEKSRKTDKAIRIIFNGMLTRSFQPGHKCDIMPVLVGSQGIGKSYFLRKCAVDDSWFNDNLNTVEGKTACEGIAGMKLCEMSELLGMKSARDVESIKAFITSCADTYRAPWDKYPVKRARTCVIVGTTNDYGFLTDKTGNRRYLPIECHKERVVSDLWNDEECDAIMLQSWAEALVEYQRFGACLHIEKDLEEEILVEQQKFLEDDPRVGLIQEYLDRRTAETPVCTYELAENVLDMKRGQIPLKVSNELHRIMRNSVPGWVPVGGSGKRKCSEWGKQQCYERSKS